ncbi:unnamed protein product [Gulo gulo]|uniref:Uncharacterized protein n=1 Tax=Gulo gulo TaxID=48420 RepID=A0A9X9M5W8_GULGU|nr:unnamed protein product [Gulo gulo]
MTNAVESWAPLPIAAPTEVLGTLGKPSAATWVFPRQAQALVSKPVLGKPLSHS